MKVMVISDLHYDKRVFHGIDESRAWEWLLGIVDYHRPDLLISLGDWGEAISETEFYDLLKRVRVWSIYGNHDNLNVLRKVYNILTDKYEPALMKDGEVRVFNGVRFGAINGITALRRKEKKGIPRKRPEEFIEYDKRLSGKVDVLLLYDSPYVPEYKGKIANDVRTQAVGIAIFEAKPRITLCGHLHLSPYTIYEFEYGVLYIRIDSSQKHRCYVMLYSNDRKLEVWKDSNFVYETEKF